MFKHMRKLAGDHKDTGGKQSNPVHKAGLRIKKLHRIAEHGVCQADDAGGCGTGRKAFAAMPPV
ncbi:hypothetical protein D3C75_1163170 [compost metagenome]